MRPQRAEREVRGRKALLSCDSQPFAAPPEASAGAILMSSRRAFSLPLTAPQRRTAAVSQRKLLEHKESS